MSNFFEDKVLVTERVQLAEEITLPDNYDEYQNIEAKFFIKIFTPLLNKDKITEESRPAPKSYSNNIQTSNYQQVNYIKLTIPRYILLQFKNSIPKGTEFIITCIGEFRLEHFRIIGLYTL